VLPHWQRWQDHCRHATVEQGRYKPTRRRRVTAGCSVAASSAQFWWRRRVRNRGRFCSACGWATRYRAAAGTHSQRRTTASSKHCQRCLQQRSVANFLRPGAAAAAATAGTRDSRGPWVPAWVRGGAAACIGDDALCAQQCDEGVRQSHGVGAERQHEERIGMPVDQRHRDGAGARRRHEQTCSKNDSAQGRVVDAGSAAGTEMPRDLHAMQQHASINAIGLLLTGSVRECHEQEQQRPGVHCRQLDAGGHDQLASDKQSIGWQQRQACKRIRKKPT